MSTLSIFFSLQEKHLWILGKTSLLQLFSMKTQWTHRKGGSVWYWGSLAAGLAIGIVGDAGVGYLRIRSFRLPSGDTSVAVACAETLSGFIFDVVLISFMYVYLLKRRRECKIRFHDCVLNGTMNQEIAYQPIISRPPSCRSVLTPSSHDSLLECRLVCATLWTNRWKLENPEVNDSDVCWLFMIFLSLIQYVWSLEGPTLRLYRVGLATWMILTGRT